MNLPLVLLTGVVMFTGVLISWGIDDRPREFFAFLFILATGVFGVFVSLDLFQLFFFYEIAVFPMYLLIAIWGWQVTREYAAMKLTLYLFIGSVVALVGGLALYYTAGLRSFDLIELQQAAQAGAFSGTVNFFGATVPFQVFWFPVVFFGFAVLGGIFPVHNWSPDGHVAAPTAVSMFHAGVLMKLGAFAALRVGIMLLPEGAQLLVGADPGAGDDQRRLRRLHRHGADRFQVRHRLLVRLAHGAGDARLRHAQPRRADRGGAADVLARRDDGSLLCCRRHGLRPGAHARDPQAGRLRQGHAAGGRGVHRRRPGLDGHARLLGLRGRVPDLHGRCGSASRWWR